MISCVLLIVVFAQDGAAGVVPAAHYDHITFKSIFLSLGKFPVAHCVTSDPVNFCSVRNHFVHVRRRGDISDVSE